MKWLLVYLGMIVGKHCVVHATDWFVLKFGKFGIVYKFSSFLCQVLPACHIKKSGINEWKPKTILLFEKCLIKKILPYLMLLTFLIIFSKLTYCAD